MGTIVHLTPRDGRPAGRIIRLTAEAIDRRLGTAASSGGARPEPPPPTRDAVVPADVTVDEAALMATVGSHILTHRTRLGLSQYALAAAIGCDRSAVCRWESGNRLPSLTHLVSLCRVLGCSPATLLGMPDPGGGRGQTAGRKT